VVVDGCTRDNREVERVPGLDFVMVDASGAAVGEVVGYAAAAVAASARVWQERGRRHQTCSKRIEGPWRWC
jgi:hypothetical protein